jgi:L-threonylcarbamoyladenylate synthase
MDGRIPLILDGGESDVGLESTVISLVGEKPCILRPGGVTKAMLETVIGEVDLAGSILRPLEKGEKALSPGMMYKHYSPDGQVTLIEGDEADVVEALRRLHAHAASEGHRACVMCFTEHVEALADCRPHDIGSRDDPAEVARRLFATLRALDDEKMDVIFSEVVPPEGVGLAIMNRLGRAAAFRTVQAEEIVGN